MQPQKAVRGKMRSAVRALTFLFGVLIPSVVQAQATTELVSHISAGTDDNIQSEVGVASANGRFIVFQSVTSNDNIRQCYVYDRQTQMTEIVSVSSSGEAGNAASLQADISADGRYVVYRSVASNLVPNDTNGFEDFFLHDRVNHTTERVNVSSSGAQANQSAGFANCAISADGRYIAFRGAADNLVPNDTNGVGDVFVRDRINHTTERISFSSNGTQGNGGSGSCNISENGQYVVFISDASNLVPGDTNGLADLFVHDRVNHTTERVNVSSSGAQANSFTNQFSSISYDGRFVVISSGASNLVPGDTNGVEDIFVHDRVNHTTERVSVSSQGIQANATSPGLGRKPISADGRYVVFGSNATNLTSDTLPVAGQVYLHDRESHTTRLISVTATGGAPNARCASGTISADGNYVMFSSAATDLVPDVTKGTQQIYVRGPLLSLSSTVSGTIMLESIVPDSAPQTLTLTFRPADHSGDIIRAVSVSPDGAFSVSGLPRTAYTLHIKGSKWLAKNVAADASNGDVTNVNATLLAGDANDDNAVDVLDLDALIQAFDTTNGGGADFNCDGSVDVLDLDILIRNFDQTGDA